MPNNMPKEISNLLKSLLGLSNDDDRDDEPEHTNCTCPACRIKDYKLPVAPPAGSDEHWLSILEAVKSVHEGGGRRLSKAGKESLKLTMVPLGAEAEDAILQLCIDTVNASCRAERTLAGLLPPGKQVPEHLLHHPITLEKAREMLQAGRDEFQKRLTVRKAEAEARADAKAAVDAALQQAQSDMRAQGGK